MNFLEELANEKRKAFKERVRALNPRQANLELGIYDVFVAAKRDFSERKEKIEEEIRLHVLRENGNPIDPQFHLRYSNYREAIAAYRTDFGIGPAYIVVLNYNHEDPKHRRGIKPGTGLFRNGLIVNAESAERRYVRSCIGKHFSMEQFQELRKIAYEDLAVPTDSEARIVATNVGLYIKDLDAKNGEEARTDNQKMGVLVEGHARLFAGSSATANMPGTVTLMLSAGEHESEEKGYIRRLFQERVTYSSHTGEDELAQERMKTGEILPLQAAHYI